MPGQRHPQWPGDARHARHHEWCRRWRRPPEARIQCEQQLRRGRGVPGALRDSAWGAWLGSSHPRQSPRVGVARRVNAWTSASPRTPSSPTGIASFSLTGTAPRDPRGPCPAGASIPVRIRRTPRCAESRDHHSSPSTRQDGGPRGVHGTISRTSKSGRAPAASADGRRRQLRNACHAMPHRRAYE